MASRWLHSAPTKASKVNRLDWHLLSARDIAGIVVGAVVAVATFGGLIWFFCRGQKRKWSQLEHGQNRTDSSPIKYHQHDMQRKSLYEMEQRVALSSAKLGESHAELNSSDICLISDDARQYDLPE